MSTEVHELHERMASFEAKQDVALNTLTKIDTKLEAMNEKVLVNQMRADEIKRRFDDHLGAEEAQNKKMAEDIAELKTTKTRMGGAIAALTAVGGFVGFVVSWIFGLAKGGHVG